MPRHTGWTSWFTPLALGLWACSSAPPVSPAPPAAPIPRMLPAPAPGTKWLDGEVLTRESFAQLGEWAAVGSSQGEALAALLPSPWPRLPVYSPRAPPVPLSEAQVDALLHEPPPLGILVPYTDRFWLRGDWRSLPNHWLFTGRVSIDTLTDVQGRPVPFKQAGEMAFQFQQQQGTRAIELAPPLEEGAKGPPTWKGTARLTVSLPVRFQVLAFTPADVGREKDGVRLVSWKGTDVVLEGEGLDGELVARGVEGARLAERQSIWHEPGKWAFYAALAKKPWEELPDQMDTPEGARRVRVMTRLEGTPTVLEFHRVERRVERTVEVPLVSQGLLRSEPSPPLAGQEGARVCDGVSAEWLRERLRVFASREGLGGSPFIGLELPACGNSLGAEVRYEDMTWLDAQGVSLPASYLRTERPDKQLPHGDRVDVVPGVRYSDETRDLDLLRLHRAQGTLHVRYPRVKKVVLALQAPGAPGPGFTPGERPGEVIPHPPDAPGGYLPYLAAYDARGLWLTREKSSEDTVRFSAPPHRLELLVREGSVDVALPMSLTWPPPPAPDVRTLAGELMTDSALRDRAGTLSHPEQRVPWKPDTEASWVRLPSYSFRAPPVALDAPDALALLDEVGPFIMLRRDESFYSKLLVGADLGALPNHGLGQVRFQLESLQDEQGQPVAFDQHTGREWGPTGGAYATFDVALEPPLRSDKDLRGWTGRVKAWVRLPLGASEATFTPADVGQQKQGVTLVSWKDAQVVMEADSDAFLQGDTVALAAGGRRLELLPPLVEYPVQRAFFEELEKRPWESLPARVEAPPGFGRVRVTWRLEGQPKALRVHQAERFVERELTRPVSFSHRPAGTSRAGAVEPVLCEGLTERQLRARVKVHATRVLERDHHGTPLLALELPACANSAFATLTFERLELLDAAGKVLPEDAYAQEAHGREEAYGAEYWFTRSQWEDKLPVVHSVRGRLRVRLPDFQRRTLTRGAGFTPGATPGEVRLQGTRAFHEALEWDNETDFQSGPFQAITAWDARNRLLPRQRSSWDRALPRGTFLEWGETFAGTPDHVVLILKKGEVEVTLPFKATFPPPPPAPRP
ncbi:hypothetical protein NR798_20080 [Archangium gephyra]|uniref:hypothetical protein n=1 Tax=Archangium gephyra TaxID=48 RepID=UPI0035D425EC